MQNVEKFKKSFFDNSSNRNYGNWLYIKGQKIIYTNGYYMVMADCKNVYEDGVLSMELIPLEGVNYPRYEDAISQKKIVAIPLHMYSNFEKLGRSSKKGYMYYNVGIGFFNTFDKLEESQYLAVFDATYISKLFKYLDKKTTKIDIIQYCTETKLLHVSAEDLKGEVSFNLMGLTL